MQLVLWHLLIHLIMVLSFKSLHSSIIQSKRILCRRFSVGASSNVQWVVQFDGGSRGNPGKSGSGVTVLKVNGTSAVREVWNESVYLGVATNNVAEYCGLIIGIRCCVANSLDNVLFQGDSSLVVNQMNNIFAVKNQNMQLYHSFAKNLLRNIPNYRIEYIARADNSRADSLANQAMDCGQVQIDLAKFMQSLDDFDFTLRDCSNATDELL